MSFNPGKTEILFFSNTSNIDNIEFSFNGKSIPLSISHKHLGVILSQNGLNTDPWGTPAETGSKLDQEFY
jgi:hypothetical protein